MPKDRNPQHIGLHEIHEAHKLLWYLAANDAGITSSRDASDRLHCDNVPKPLSWRLFLIACAHSCRESRLARNITALQLDAAF